MDEGNRSKIDDFVNRLSREEALRLKAIITYEMSMYEFVNKLNKEEIEYLASVLNKDAKPEYRNQLRRIKPKTNILVLLLALFALSIGVGLWIARSLPQ